MKRQSTVQKFSATILRQLIEFCRNYNCGIIIRVGGVEYGYDASQLEFTFGSIIQGKISVSRFFEIVGSVVPTIRKGWNSLDGLTTTSLPQQTNKLSKGSENG